MKNIVISALVLIATAGTAMAHNTIHPGLRRSDGVLPGVYGNECRMARGNLPNACRTTLTCDQVRKNGNKTATWCVKTK